MPYPRREAGRHKPEDLRAIKVPATGRIDRERERSTSWQGRGLSVSEWMCMCGLWRAHSSNDVLAQVPSAAPSFVSVIILPSQTLPAPVRSASCHILSNPT